MIKGTAYANIKIICLDVQYMNINTCKQHITTLKGKIYVHLNRDRKTLAKSNTLSW